MTIQIIVSDNLAEELKDIPDDILDEIEAHGLSVNRIITLTCRCCCGNFEDCENCSMGRSI